MKPAAQRTRLVSSTVPFFVHVLFSSCRGSSAWITPFRSSGVAAPSDGWSVDNARSSLSPSVFGTKTKRTWSSECIASSYVKSSLHSTPPWVSTHSAEPSGMHRDNHPSHNPDSEPATAKQRISFHLAKASHAQSSDDTATQHTEVELAEQELLQWVELYRHTSSDTDKHGSEYVGDVERPELQVFNDVIWALLALPSSYSVAVDALEAYTSNRQDASLSFIDTIDNNDAEDASKRMNQLRVVMGRSKLRNVHKTGGGSVLESKSERATRILDLMESLYEPLGSVYDEITASHCVDALECLSHPQKQQDNEEDSHHYYNQAWKSAKLASSLLTRSGKC